MNRRIESLDGLRGLAILLVMTTHLYHPPTRMLLKLTDIGWIGVDLFFVLSGFLITGILIEGKRASGHYFGNFYARRALRIFPIYYALLAICLFVAPHSPRTDLLAERQAWYWTYTTNIAIALHGNTYLPPNWGLFWSLAVEEQFYLLWPAVVYVCSVRQLRYVCGVCIVAAWALRLGLTLAGVSPYTLYTLTPTRMDSLFVGAWLALVASEPLGLRGHERTAGRVMVGASGLLACLFLARHGLRGGDPVIQVVGMPLLAILFGATLVLGVTGRLPILAHPALHFWAPYSYGLYVVHGPITVPLMKRVDPWLWGTGNVHALLHFGTGVAVSLVIAMLSWHLFEHPILSLRPRQLRTEHHAAISLVSAAPLRGDDRQILARDERNFEVG